MIRSTIVLMLGIFLASACNTAPRKQPTQKQKAGKRLAQKDRQIRDLRSALESIELRIGEISQEFPLARVKPDKLPATAQRIFQNLDQLENEVDHTHNSLSQMERQNLSKSNKLEISENWIDTLEGRLSKHSRKLAALEKVLKNTTGRVQILQRENNQLAHTRDSLVRAQNLAWFTYGSPNQLRQHGIIEKRGDVLGIGGRWELMPDKGNGFYQPVDKRLVSEIPVESDKVELVSDHPKNSYAWEYHDEMSVLHILNPQSFWKFSKYLAVVAR